MHSRHNFEQEENLVLAGFSPDAIRRQLAKISASNAFANSTRMKRFLSLAVEYTLAARAHELKEYLIGVEVFDRDVSFDPRLDPIVRVEARRLRTKLVAYYEGPGLEDELIIEFVKGAYVPQFRSRSVLAAPEPHPDSIAVLPFRDLGPEPNHEYFSDGLSEELIHVLTRVPGLRVVAWHSAAQLKNDEHNLAYIRQQLGVETVLSGSVRRSGDQLRITAKLISTSDGRYLWTEVYDRRMHDLFAIEEDIARSIVNTLQIKLGRRPLARVAGQEMPNAEAHNLYLLGRYHSNRRTPDGLRKSIECFEKAISLDQGNALSYAALSETYDLLADYAIMLPSESVPMARAAARRALELDPMLGEAYTSLAFIRSNYDWQWDEAETLYRRAIELNPGYATARHWFGIDQLAMQGRFDQAFAEIETAVRLDPLSAIILQGKGFLHLLSGQYEQAITIYRQVLDLDPFFYMAFSSMGRARTQQGRYAEAIELLKHARSLNGEIPNILGAMGQTYALAGMKAEARLTLAELTGLAQQRYVPATCSALIHIGLGEIEKALHLLEQGAERRDFTLASLKVHPAYDAIRPEPRFRALLQRIGLGMP
jgi:serine/threonine-protein kinase